MDLDSDIILTQFGGTKANDLNEKLHLYDENDNEMSLNCQSINAKFGMLECLLN